MPSRVSIETERLLLRPWRESDRDAFVSLNTEEEFNWFAMRRAMTPDEAAEAFDRVRAHWRSHGFGLFASEEKQTGTLLGYTGLEIPTFLPIVLPAVEIGWRYGKAHWGKGYALEGARASLGFGFEDMLLDRIICIYEPVNERSAGLAAKLGMRTFLETPHPTRGVQVHVAELRRALWPG